MSETPPPRRPGIPGGSLPPSVARPRAPASNGKDITPVHDERRPLGVVRAAWQDLDAEELDHTAEVAQRTEFRRLMEMTPERAVRAGSTPSPVVWLGIFIVALVIALAVILYRLAPP
ncbi:MAG TPA: hypothetical protein VG266_07400 [Candidatus Dormibacteraeota bacterium]|jgi:hypothetical protein|nr:hypothetical protein [Candidatus Dormibacteraeota bacterium]